MVWWRGREGRSEERGGRSEERTLITRGVVSLFCSKHEKYQTLSYGPRPLLPPPGAGPRPHRV